jgi:hypothetical protein
MTQINTYQNVGTSLNGSNKNGTKKKENHRGIPEIKICQNVLNFRHYGFTVPSALREELQHDYYPLPYLEKS